MKQNANLGQMTRCVAAQIRWFSEALEWMPGDLVDSGMPQNVGRVVAGDLIEGHIDGLPNLSANIV